MKNTTNVIAIGVLLMLVLGCSLLKKNIQKSSSSYNPYKGALTELLQSEISSSLVKFKLSGIIDATTYTGSTEAKAFTYMQEGAGVSVQLDGALANYPSAELASKALADLASNSKGTLTKKHNGQRFASPKGESIAWTNGSLLCIVRSSFAKPAGNFEEAAPF